MKYRKKPGEINAIQYTGNNKDEILVKLEMLKIGEDFLSNDLLIETLEGKLIVKEGDYIVWGYSSKLDFHFWTVKQNYFEENYEKTEMKYCKFCDGTFDLLDDGPKENIVYFVHCRSCYSRTLDYPTIEEAQNAWDNGNYNKYTE